jgi:hypothetical protein
MNMEMLLFHFTLLGSLSFRYDGAEGIADPTAPTMALAFENGRIQILRHDTDDNPVACRASTFFFFFEGVRACLMICSVNVVRV